MHVGGGEEAVVGRDQREIAHIRQRDHAGFDGAIGVQAVAVQFDHGAAGERLFHDVQQAFGVLPLPLRQHPADRTRRAAGEQKQAGSAGSDTVPGLLRLETGVGVEEALRR